MEFWESSDITIDGILTPDIDESRKLIFLDTEEEIPLEVEETYRGEVIRVGRYIFSQQSFEIAKKKIESLHNSQSRLIIIDEIGTLEVNNLGFEPSLSAYIDYFKTNVEHSQLILVVRDTLLSKVIEKYNLDNAQVLSLHLFNQIFLSE